MIDVSGLRKVYRVGAARSSPSTASTCTSARARSSASRPERRRQVHPHPLRQPAGAPHRRHRHRGRPGLTALARQGASSAAARSRIGMVFQHFNLLSSRTVAGNVDASRWRSSASPGGARPQGRASCSTWSASPDKAGTHPAPALRRAEAARRHRPRAGRRTPRCCSPTRPPPRSTRRPPARSWPLLRDLNRQLGLTVLLITHEMDVVKTDLRLGRPHEAAAGSSSPAPSPNCSPRPAPSWPRELFPVGGRPRRPAHGRRRHLPRASRRRAGDLAAGRARTTCDIIILGAAMDDRRRQLGRPDADRAARPLRGRPSCRSASCASRACRSRWPRRPSAHGASGTRPRRRRRRSPSDLGRDAAAARPRRRCDTL